MPRRKRESLGARLRAARQAAGLSQAELSVRSGLPKPTLSRYENDHVAPSVATLRRIASALDVTVSDLLPVGDRGKSYMNHALDLRGMEVESDAEAERLLDMLDEGESESFRHRRRKRA